MVEVDDTVPAVEKSCRRTDIHAGSIFTVVAAQDRKVSPDGGEAPFFDIFNPGPKLSQRNLVFRLAGDRARMAPDATPVVDRKTVVHA